MLILDQLTVGYSGARGAVLSRINATAKPGDFICLLGRNGAGKSTLMRTIAGLQASLSGDIALENEKIATMRPSTRARRIAVVLTERPISPGLTVNDVIALGRMPYTSWAGRLSVEDKTLISKALTMTKATEFAGRLFDSLSDGERQRVMIARAIVQTPKLMILDEITAFLDLPGRVEVMALLRQHARETKAIVLLSSHDLDLSLQLADTIWLVGSDGKFDIGRPDQLCENGVINQAFDTHEVKFSPALKRFKLSE